MRCCASLTERSALLHQRSASQRNCNYYVRSEVKYILARANIEMANTGGEIKSESAPKRQKLQAEKGKHAPGYI